MVDNATFDSRMKRNIISNKQMGTFCVFHRNQKSFEKYFDDKEIDEIDLGRMVGKYCLSYIFGISRWLIRVFINSVCHSVDFRCMIIKEFSLCKL